MPVLVEGVNDLLTVNPKLAEEAHGWNPAKISANSHKKLMWKCKQNHIFEATLTNRNNCKSTCPYCNGNKVWPGFNDLATKFPLVADEAYNFDPAITNAFSHSKFQWCCTICNHIFTMTVLHRTNNKANCPFCAGKVVIKGLNDFYTTHHEIAQELCNVEEATQYTYGSKKKLWWKCDNGHKYEAAICHRICSESGCPFCPNPRYNYELPSFLYLLRKPDRFKVGIYNSHTNRLVIHKRNGWNLIEKIGPIKGGFIKEIENTIKQLFRTKKIKTGKNAFEFKFDGWNESWLKSDFPVTSLTDLWDKL